MSEDLRYTEAKLTVVMLGRIPRRGVGGMEMKSGTVIPGELGSSLESWEVGWLGF